jgi:hypothetical protein
VEREEVRLSDLFDPIRVLADSLHSADPIDNRFSPLPPLLASSPRHDNIQMKRKADSSDVERSSDEEDAAKNSGDDYTDRASDAEEGSDEDSGANSDEDNTKQSTAADTLIASHGSEAGWSTALKDAFERGAPFPLRPSS